MGSSNFFSPPQSGCGCLWTWRPGWRGLSPQNVQPRSFKAPTGPAIMVLHPCSLSPFSTGGSQPPYSALLHCPPLSSIWRAEPRSSCASGPGKHPATCWDRTQYVVCGYAHLMEIKDTDLISSFHLCLFIQKFLQLWTRCELLHILWPSALSKVVASGHSWASSKKSLLPSF